MHGLYRHRNLPHLDVPGGTYFATFCLAGSLPGGREPTAVERRPAHSPGSPIRRASPGERARRASEAFAAFDRLLDQSPRVPWFSDHRLADIVRRSLLHGHGSRYDLLAFVVMPNHCHVVFTPLADTIGGRPAREAILHAIKRHTAYHCNRLLRRAGAFWQAESYERVIRSLAALETVIAYVEHNPVRAGLCAAPEAWEFSSAHVRPLALEIRLAGAPRCPTIARP